MSGSENFICNFHVQKQIEKEKINVFRQMNLFREDIDAWRQDLIQNRGSIIGYLITTKYSHTMRKMNVMQINKRRVRDDRVRVKQRIYISTDL